LNRSVALYYFQLATEALSDLDAARVLPERQGAWDTNPVLSSFRVDASKRLVIGSVGRLDRFGDRVHPSWARRNLARVYPFLAGQPLTHAWFGRIGITSDRLPRLAEPAPGMVTIYGYNGRGIGPGTVFGREIAEFLAGGTRNALSLPWVEKRSEPFATARSTAIEIGARLYHLIT
jgi:glycine/D-amino acid oxidase-like deaminating enzyme